MFACLLVCARVLVGLLLFVFVACAFVGRRCRSVFVCLVRLARLVCPWLLVCVHVFVVLCA